MTKPHIPPQVSIETYRGASLIRLKVPGGKQLPPENTRSEITEFSSQSRRRLLLFMARILRACLPFMLTLTYPAEFAADPEVYKAHLEAWLKRLKRQYPQIGAIWKLEFQKRGAPHYHLFLWGLPVDSFLAGVKLTPENLRAAPCYSEFDKWARRAWFEVVGSGDTLHLHHGTKFEAIRSPQGIMRYVAGYMSKDDQTAPGKAVGRYWGVHNKAVIPLAPADEEAIPAEAYPALRRAARRFMHANRMVAFHAARRAGRKMPKPRQRNNPSVCLLCDVDQWLRRIPAIVDNRRWWLDRQACNTQR